MGQEHDRFSLSRDIELLANRIAGAGHAARADELKVVAAHLRAKEAARRGRGAAEPPKAYVLGIALVMSWLAVVLLAVVLLA